jgi:hypothetical protein
MTPYMLIVLVVVLILVFWLLDTYVVPALPAPAGRIILAVLALLTALWLLSTFLGWNTGLRWPR